MKISLGNMSMGAKLTALSSALVLVAFALFTVLAVSSTTRAADEKSLSSLNNQTNQVLDMLATYDAALRQSVELAGRALSARYAGGFALDASQSIEVGGTAAPVLQHGGRPVNNDFSGVDGFTKDTGAVATVFVRKGDDLLRIATSLKKQDGTRAVGTLLERTHPAHAKLLQGEAFAGKASLFGKDYMTQYLPIRDASGTIVGALFIGLDFTEGLKVLNAKVRSLRIGETGYVFAVDASPARAGLLTIHPTKEGQSVLAAKDSAGNEFIRTMLETKQGVIRYPWLNEELGEKDAREKIVVYGHFAPWNWVIGGGSYMDEFTRDAVRLRNVLIGASAATVLLLTAFLYWTFVRVISRPMRAAVLVAERVGAGDLTSRIEPKGADEIAQLMRALKAMNESLAGIVAGVRASTDEISTASQGIAAGNADLSRRTEQQASSLEETAASMEELASTVRQNADNAKQANQLATAASGVAEKGGAVVGEVVQTMSSINEASRKIADIIGAIDGIAFQTNILALNAAVEAARAGEQGRGFAVVAAEVRTLAQRSAAAAKEIKQLIADSVAKVDTGSRLVDEAGKTMDEIVASVQRVTHIMADIARASSDQSAGIEQVNQAVAQMDQVTQQNAALVEEASAAAQSLKEQSVGLVDSVSVFKLAADSQARQVIAHAQFASKTLAAAPAALPDVVRKPSLRKGAVAHLPLASGAAEGDKDWKEF